MYSDHLAQKDLKEAKNKMLATQTRRANFWSFWIQL